MEAFHSSKTKLPKPPELPDEIWKEVGLGEEREAPGRLRMSFERERTKGYSGFETSKIQSPKLSQMFRTSEECPKLPQEVRNFRGKVQNFRRFQINSANFEI